MTLRRVARSVLSARRDRAGRFGRVVRQVATVTGFLLVLTLGVPAGQVGAPGHRDFPLSWLRSAVGPGM